jgi:hypothetical protein
MADAPRPKPVEYYNPRLLILGLCFFWGIAMGFCMFYFAPPKQMLGQSQRDGAQQDVVPVATMSDRERRRIDAPDIATVEPTPETIQTANRLKIETMEMEPPIPILTTEGGLTGRTTHILGQGRGQTPSAGSSPEPRARPPALSQPPPIPELLP